MFKHTLFLRCLTLCALLITAPAFTSAAEKAGTLQQVLATFNDGAKAPGLVAAVVKNGKIVEIAAVGVSNAETRTPINPDRDMFHWGSVSKSVTGTMIAGLVKEGRLSWDMTLAQVFPNTPMREEYRATTLAQLMNHRANLPAYTRLSPVEGQRFAAYSGTDVEKRDAFVREVLLEPPVMQEGNDLVYSNAGPAIAAHAAEVITGKSWEDLVRAYVFTPLKMTTAGFGLPATIERPNQTRGHIGGSADDLAMLGLGPMPGHPILDAAGNISSTVGDFALYGLAHLEGLNNSNGALDAKSIQFLHTPPEDGKTIGGGKGKYAIGWGLRQEGNHVVHWHNGSAGAFFAQADLYPDENIAIVVMTNAGFVGRRIPELIDQIHNLYSK